MNKDFEMMWKKIFENHVATVQEIDKDTQILSWKEDGTIVYSLEFIFRENKVYVGGDLGYGTFFTTWIPRWNSDWEHINPSYFAEKCVCIKNERYVWDEEQALSNLKKEYESSLSDKYSESEFEGIFNQVEELADSWNDDWVLVEDEDVFIENENNIEYLKQMWCVIKTLRCTSTQEEYVYTLQNDHDFSDFNDFWEWGYNVGRKLNGYFSIWIIALRMAKQQLLNNHMKIEDM